MKHVILYALTLLAIAVLAMLQRRQEGLYRAPTVRAVRTVQTCSKSFDDFPRGFDSKNYPRSRMAVLRPGVVAITCGPREHGSKGGVILRSDSTCRGAREIKLTFDVKFGETGKRFDFGRGGKVGLGVQFGQGDIQGGDWLPTAASARLMFREDGRATGYVYYGKRASSKLDAVNDQHRDYALVAYPTGTGGHDLWLEGKSRRPPLPRFKSGAWQTVSLYCRMNTPNRQDGVIEVTIDGTTRRFDKMRWLDDPAGVNNVQFCVWYGGSTDDWAPKTKQTFFFKNLTAS